ncbi:MAG: cyclic nucleotide-binding domain-containing protein [Nitrospirae bacterium]|nr:MAG: cyclic nucleotide-binding domain-containing protein [Nitrospirota bacterium]
MSRENWEIYFGAVKKQDWAKARSALNEIAKIDKKNPQVYLKMGDVCQRAGDTPSAVKAYHISARIQFLQGFHQKAIALYKIILRLEPGNAEALGRTEQIVQEIEESRGQHIWPAAAAQEPHVQSITEELVETQALSSDLPPDTASPSPEGAGWLERTSLEPADEPSQPGEPPEEELPQKEPPVPSDQPAGSWLETTALEVPDTVADTIPDTVPELMPNQLTEPASDTGPAETNVPLTYEELTLQNEASSQMPPDDGTGFIDGPGGGLSLDEIFSEMPEDDFQKMLDDLVVPLSERQAAASEVPELFSGMSPEEYSSALGELSQKVYAGGTPVVEEGDSGDSMFLVRSGSARVVAHMLGREIELARLGEGDLFGEVAFLTGRPRTASVIADGALEVYEINRVDIERMIDRNPEILSRLEGFYETRVKDTIQKIVPKQS